MELLNSFVIPAGIGDAWTMLLDIEAMAPCVVGATLLSVDGDRYAGIVKVKLGPVTMSYEGEAVVVERDEAARRALIEGVGRESKGLGTARTLSTVQMVAESADCTRVDVATVLTVSGTAARFGRDVLADASRRVVDQFAGNLAHLIDVRRAAGHHASAGSQAT